MTQSQDAVAGMSEPQAAIPQFRDSTQLSQWLIALLCISLAVDAIATVSEAMQYNLLQQFKAGTLTAPGEAQAAAEANDMRQRIIAGAQVVLIISTIAVFARWIYRANVNARALGAQGMKYTPAWSVGWYFIPFANLWKPYQAMREIWKASQQPADWQPVRPTALLGWWWALFLISGILGNLSFRLTLEAKGIDGLLRTTVVTLLSDAVSVVAAVAAILLVRKIYGLQHAHPVAQ